MRYFLTAFSILILLFSCGETPVIKRDKLPIIGNRDIVDGDTVYHTVPDFAFHNQDSQLVNLETFKDEIFVIDLFFTSCPTICPKVTKQMLRLHEKYKEDDRISLISLTIDPARDDVEKLKTYSTNLEVTAPKWHFLTGDKWEIYEIAPGYFSIAHEDAEAPGGFNHSGRLILVDKNHHVRSFCDGTDENSVDGFLEDVDLLLEKEY